ncbi:MAG TPA: efflux RND transporter periplasmic adaptor subunit [Pirellulales bacterium]|jgi:cobalt-zinc-cadmium efflux system membrane fusion protein|nr:efflux RND transporter periplasmic adaptor subunit [Pirellulales bacterium]
MNSRNRWTRIVVLGVVVVVLAVGTVFALQMVRPWKKKTSPEPQPQAQEARPRVQLVSGQANTLEVPHDIAGIMQLQTSQVETAPPPSPLKLEGSLFLDPNRLTHVHTRFPGEVVDLGVVGVLDGADQADRRTEQALRFGDQVKKGQLLAVIWSKDLGEKKSELIDALSRLKLDQETLKRLETLFRDGALPERSLREQERIVEQDVIAASRAEYTLRSWRLSDADLQAIRTEAERIHARQGVWDAKSEENWARVEVRAAIDGTIVEKNIAVGDVVDTQLDLFKIANLERLGVLAHAYEEDLRLLEDLAPTARHWSIHLKSDPQARPLEGSFDQIGRIIDPYQHTALVMGWVDNKGGRLRVGQFVTAVVDLPAFPNEVAVPTSAMVDQEGETYVFVQENPEQSRFTARHVIPVRRRDEYVYLVSKPKPQQRTAGYDGLRPREIIVVSGCLELAQALHDLQAAAQAQVAHK